MTTHDALAALAATGYVRVRDAQQALEVAEEFARQYHERPAMMFRLHQRDSDGWWLKWGDRVR